MMMMLMTTTTKMNVIISLRTQFKFRVVLWMESKTRAPELLNLLTELKKKKKK